MTVHILHPQAEQGEAKMLIKEPPKRLRVTQEAFEETWI